MDTTTSPELEQAIAVLNEFSEDEIADLIDLLRFNLRIASVQDINHERLGKGRGDLNSIRDTIRRSPKLRSILEMIQPSRLAQEERRTLLQTATVLQDTLSSRTTSSSEKESLTGKQPRGHLETKRIKRVINSDPTISHVRWCGPYLYLRYWVNQPDESGQPRWVLKNKYLGHRRLATHYANLPKGSAEKQALAEQIMIAYENNHLSILEKEVIGSSST